MIYKIPNKILLINIFGIGDVLFTTPLIANLKKADPQVQIGYLCNHRAEPILRSDPYVNKVFIYDRDEFHAVQQKSLWAYVQKVNGVIQEIRREGYGLVLDVSMTDLMGFISWAAGIKERVGLSYKRRGRFLTRKIGLKGFEGRHVVEYYLDLLRELGLEPQENRMRLCVSPNDVQWAQNLFNELGVKPASTVVIVPGGGASWGKEALYKRWGPENYAKLADKIIEKCSADIILMGDQNEMALCQEVASAMKNRPKMAAGRTTVMQFAAVAKAVKLCIVNDGGPLHIAVASGGRILSIFGPVDEKVYGPYPADQQTVVAASVACRPCYRNFRRASCDHISCLKQISTDEVFRKAEGLL
ncbi:MAG: glycosyltransferase family 9 protein [Candidatus Omnitrophica bacterium]|nr:glycosyltransferase family 9 protein [Candidatus Omnitrophota bacterium]